MNTQMSLEEYKKKVVELMSERTKLTTADKNRLLNNNKELWEACLEDFSPEECAQGMLSGLL